MKERVVVKKSSRQDAGAAVREFNFSRDMVSALNPSWEGPEWIRSYRQSAWEIFERLPMPSTQDEAWRRTDLRQIEAGSFRLVESGVKFPDASPELLAPLVSDSHGGQIVLSPNHRTVTLSPDLEKQGVVFTDYSTAEKMYPDLLAKILGKLVRPDEGKFASMAASFAQSGVFVYIPKNVVVEAPLHSVLWGPGVNQAVFSHVLVYLEDGASVTYVHEMASPTEAVGQSLHAGIVEIHVGAGAHLNFVELQSWGEHYWNFTHERARVGRDGTLDWIFGAIGSHLTKNFSDLDLAEEGSTGRMSGFYFTDGVQHLDHDTQQNHLAPNTTSDLLFKGALKDQSRSVWQGMIYVAPGAQKTDGYQANRNLVLSTSARADSIPGLEILADDVRCTHGATVGKIDPEQVFYLLSRGMDYPQAERLIVEGFFDPIMQRIPFEGVRERLKQSILDKMR